MPRRDVALGDRHKARETRFGGEQVVAARVELALRDEITNREELAIRIEEKAELHRFGHRSRRRLQRRKALVQRLGALWRSGSRRAGDCRSISVSPAPRRAFRRRPRLRVRGQRSRDIDHGRGLMREVHQPCRKFLWLRMISAECRAQGIERAIKLLCRGRTGFAGRREVLEWRHVPGLSASSMPANSSGGRQRAADPLPAGIRKRDQMSSQIAAIHRGDVPRVQRAKISACRTNCRNGRGSAAGRSSLRASLPSRSTVSVVPGPSEVAGADRGEKIEAEIGGRGPVGEYGLWVFLEIVRRQHVVRRRDEGLEVAPGTARDQPQGARVGLGDR